MRPKKNIYKCKALGGARFCSSTIFGVHGGYIRPRKQRTCGYIRVHSGTFGTLYVQEAVVADVAGPNFCFMWGGTFGATSLSFYNTKREEELCPEAAPRPVGSRILPANDRSHTSPCHGVFPEPLAGVGRRQLLEPPAVLEVGL